MLEEPAHQSRTDLVLLGAAAVAASGWLLLWFAIFFACLATFMRFWDEPLLVQRYGTDYVNYRQKVPALDPPNFGLDAERIRASCRLAIRHRP